MAVPKRRTPRAKRDSRRSHHGLTAPNLVRCTTCRSMRLNHRVCPVCGTYRGRQVLKRDEPLG
jgi:large subunit ribosomal protein L32